MNNEIINFAKKIFSYPRSITGSGVRKTLKEIKKIVPNLKICKIKSNTKVFDWKVPLEWKVNEAYIVTPNGKKICDFKKNNLHLVGYSIPINKIITKNELEKHLYSLPKQPNAIPYITSYYKKNWGFCISENARKKLKKGKYKIVINTSLFNGVLNYGEILIKGKSKKEVFLSSYICHPSMANNEISGPSVLTFIAKFINSLKNKKYSYRIIFIPETIGSIVYLSKNLKSLKQNMIYGFNISCVGDDREYSYLQSKYGNTLSDKVALRVLNAKVKKFKRYNWLSRGSDERQFCAPGVDLPVCSILRTKHGMYPEYHTSLDIIGKVVTKKGLNGSYNIYKTCIETIEKDLIPVSNIRCEPQMGKRGLYPNISTKIPAIKTRLMMNILSYCDESNSVFDISKLCNISTVETLKVINLLHKNKIIKYIK
jgi:aminopeptidase-like protein